MINGCYTGTFRGLVPRYVAGVFTTPPDFHDPLFLNVFTGHLWFLHHLLLISLLVLPILICLKTETGIRFTSRLARWCGKRGGVFLFLIPLIIVRAAFTHLFEGHHSWAHLFTYAVLFVIGYLMPADERFTEGMK